MDNFYVSWNLLYIRRGRACFVCSLLRYKWPTRQYLDNNFCFLLIRLSIFFFFFFNIYFVVFLWSWNHVHRHVIKKSKTNQLYRHFTRRVTKKYHPTKFSFALAHGLSKLQEWMSLQEGVITKWSPIFKIKTMTNLLKTLTIQIISPSYDILKY